MTTKHVKSPILLVGLVILILAALVILVLYQQGVFSTEPEAGTTQVAEIDQMIQVYTQWRLQDGQHWRPGFGRMPTIWL